MIKTKLRANERRQDTARLASHQIFPLVDDGPAAQLVTSPLRGGPDSYLTRTRQGGWRQVFIHPSRAQLAQARYQDWLADRDFQKRIAA